MRNSLKFFGFVLLTLLVHTSVRAQLCTGSLGDPLVFIDFGAGGGGPLPAGTTTYNYQSVTCPNDGNYTISSALNESCFGASWHTLPTDHTPGDVNGNMMIVNAALDAGDFYVVPVRGLCSNTTYEFSAWIGNLLRTSACASNRVSPNITFRIESTNGNVLGTYNTGTIVETINFEWRQYGFFFQLPPGETELVLRMTNNAPGGCGNDLVLDDIAFRPCGPLTNSGFSPAEGFPPGTRTISYCLSNATERLLETAPSAFLNPAFQWQISTNNGSSWTDIAGATQSAVTVFPNQPGIFQYRVQSAELQNMGNTGCRVNSNALTIEIFSEPSINIVVPTPICEGSNWTLFNNAAGQTGPGWNYTWTGPNGFVSNEINPSLLANTNQSGNYQLTIESPQGCTNTGNANASVSIRPIPEAGPQQEICANNEIELSGTASGGNNINLQWLSIRLDGQEIPIPGTEILISNLPEIRLTPTDSTRYYLRAENEFGCVALDSIDVWVHRLPAAFAGADRAIFEGDTVVAGARVLGTDVSIRWTPTTNISDPGDPNPLLWPTQNTTYRLEVSSEKGCGMAFDEVFIRVYKTPRIPNVFSPNGDGINDEWVIGELDNYPDARLEVYNRYGQKVWENRKGSLIRWNGRMGMGAMVPVGTYYYLLYLLPELPPKKGWVQVIK